MATVTSKEAEELKNEFEKVGIRLEGISPFGGIKSVIAASEDEEVRQMRKESTDFEIFFQAKIRMIKTKPGYEHLLNLLDKARLEAKESWIILSALLLDLYGEQIHRQYLTRYFVEDKQLAGQYAHTRAIAILASRRN